MNEERNSAPPLIPLVDAHHHLWDLDANFYPWLSQEPSQEMINGDITPIRTSYRLEDYLADARDYNLEKSVHVQCGWDPSDPVGETAWLQEVADRHGFPHGIVAFAELEHPDVQQLLERHARFKNVRGIRQILNHHVDPVLSFVDRDDYMVDPMWRRGYGLLERHGYSFDMQLYPHQMDDAARLAYDYLGIPMIINHAGMPLDRSNGGASMWLRGLSRLAEFEHVSIKISGMGLVDHHWTVESIRPFVLKTIELFGVERCMFASNFPVDRLYSSWNDLYSAFDRITSDFSEGDKRLMFGANALRIYRLGAGEKEYERRDSRQ